MEIPFSKHITAFMISASITAILVFLVLVEVNLPILTALELKSRDLRFLIRGVEKPGGDVVIVAIDDRSIEAIGRWPWPRSAMAQIIARLYEGGARVIGFDLLFTEPEDNPEMQQIRELIKTYTQMGLLDSNPLNKAFFEEMIDAAEKTDNDAIFSATAQEAGNVVLAMAFVPSDMSPKEFPPFLTRAAYESFENLEKLDDFYPASFQGDLLPIPVLAESAAQLGFVNLIPDPDGAIRQGITALEHGGALFAPLSVRVAQRHLNLENEDLTLIIGKKLQLGSYFVPMNNNGMFHINYYGPNQTIPHYSFVDVLSGAVKPEVFNGKSVFIGGTAIGLGDLWPNPFVRSFWGVETQATIADNILSQRFLLRPQWIKYVDTGVIGILGLLLGLLLSRLRIAWCAPFTISLIILLVAVNQYVFEQHRILLLWIYPLLETGLVCGSIFFFRYFTEGKEKRILKGAFQQYMNPSVVNRIIEHPEKLVLGGEKKDLTVMFSDIRGFTSISEQLPPDVLVHFMNKYLTAMTDIVLEYEGTLDKYIGDAIMAIYGAPEDQDDHATRACRTAVRMMESLHEKRKEWVKEGLPLVRIGVGINTGEMVVGNMGSQRRFDYTVMGDNVNLASRLEGLSKLYGVKILVSEFTQKKAKDHFFFRELDLVQVKGKEKPVRIFELIGKDYFTQGRYAFIHPFHQGLEAYRRQDWDEAIHLFEEVLYLKPQDNPATLFVKRCQALKKMPPAKDWDGVYTAKEK